MRTAMASKFALTLSVALGIGLAANTLMAIAEDTTGHGKSGHGTTAHVSTPTMGNRMNVTRTGTVETKYPPQLAIQLFTGEGEKYWLGDAGWNPSFPRGDGFDQGDVFVVGSNTFITITYDAATGVAQYARVEQGKSAGIIDIQVSSNGSGSVANVTYRTAGLSDAGDAAIGALTDEAFKAQMASWQAAIEANNDAIHRWLASRN